MRIKSLAIRTRDLKVNIEATSHNSLRWAMQAIDTNSHLADSLALQSQTAPVLLTDSIYMLTHDMDAGHVPLHTHVILWDGLNSHVELMTRFPAMKERQDLRYFVVGWLEGVALARDVYMEPLYPAQLSAQARRWKSIANPWSRYHAPYAYRALTSFLTHTRYAKNWLADAAKHRSLAKGGKIVFCGLVTPTPHNIDSFFMGVTWPELRAACEGLSTVGYNSGGQAITAVLEGIFSALKRTQWADTPAAAACIYSLLNVMHRILVLSYLHALGANLFVNEARNSSRFDPYDSFFYKRNFYLDFGSTRGPDAIYPRTLDLCMTGKHFQSLRFLEAGQELRGYVDNLTLAGFEQTCREHARRAMATSRELPFNSMLNLKERYESQ